VTALLVRAVRLGSEVLAGRSLPGMATTTNPWPRCMTEVPSSHEFTWSGSAVGSESFNSEAAAVGIRGTAGAVGIADVVWILDQFRRVRRAVGVTGRIGVIGVRAQLAAIVPLLVIQPRDICPAIVLMYKYKTRPQSYNLIDGIQRRLKRVYRGRSWQSKRSACIWFAGTRNQP